MDGVLYKILTLICLLIVMTKSMMKYTTRIGQNTGMLNREKKVQNRAMRMARVADNLQGEKGIEGDHTLV